MAKTATSLRFESREIAVILSLFIFVSLLMFTVGVVVGKGLAQAKYQGSLELAASERALESPSNSHASHESGSAPKTPTGTSVSSNPPVPAPQAPAAAHAHTDTPQEDLGQPLELKPKKSTHLNVHDEIGSEAESDETQSVLSNPKLSHLFESEKTPSPAKMPRSQAVAVAKEKSGDVEIERDYSVSIEPRKVASLSKQVPVSYPAGPFSVQIAAYSEESQAQERVETLKKLGFPHAYLSSIRLGDGKETWYRVWLGYYPTMAAAKSGGDALQALGEVKNYLVRKSENSGQKN